MVIACYLSILAAAGPGCDRPNDLVPVQGHVVFSDDEPVRWGVVEFVPAAQPGRTARGRIGADGRFMLETEGVPGVQEGRYRVAVVQITPPGGEPGHRGHRTVAERFGRLDRSGISQEVWRGMEPDLKIVGASREPCRADHSPGP
jgi:hypothetical protein